MNGEEDGAYRALGGGKVNDGDSVPRGGGEVVVVGVEPNEEDVGNTLVGGAVGEGIGSRGSGCRDGVLLGEDGKV